jgi:hypothetical protein
MNQFGLKALLLTIIVPLATLITVAEPAAAKINCAKLDSEPPVVNHPTHILNVIWRNKQAHCQYEKVIAQQKSSRAQNSDKKATSQVELPQSKTSSGEADSK